MKFFNFQKLSSRQILHVDGDSFFASCEVAVNPRLRGKAVVTGQERGIVTAMTKEAKALGVTRGLPIFQLRKLFPEIIVVQSDYRLYSLFSRRMNNIVKRYSDKVHEYSVDECFADLGDIIEERSGNAKGVVESIKHDLQNELGMTFSLGLAPTKVLAKIASKTRKPDGLTLISHTNTQAFLESVPIQKVWGIGRETSKFLFSKGIKTAFEFSSMREDIVKTLVSKPYYEIYLELNGISMSDCTEDKNENSKSISRTRTFHPSTSDQRVLLSELSQNIEDACVALRKDDLVSGAFSFFIKNSDFRYYRHEIVLPHPTSSPEEIIEHVRSNFHKIYIKGLIYRSSGVTLMQVRKENIFTPDFFGSYEKVQKRHGLYKVIDKILRRQGSGALSLVSSMKQGKKENNNFKKSIGLKTSFLDQLPYPYIGEVI